MPWLTSLHASMDVPRWRDIHHVVKREIGKYMKVYENGGGK
jgi:hypothetical protein